MPIEHQGIAGIDANGPLRADGKLVATGGNYGHAVTEGNALCRVMLGYRLPELMRKLVLRDCR